ncbi:uncharacterized protein LOC130591446 [Beta vulgaris subsp. vulgaris]|uniref:uncharacterized protein LOC130591446 n=1 Tax=Beta vulgaris subsp. vulgaris TaxID=3555 RepID=UPI002547275F|nr:uncharacterized protein LOC130591446 [Beta vulgaris subsp. vulgaris]
MKESESDKESEPVDVSEPENQEMEEEEVEKEEAVIVEKAKKVVAQKPSSKAVKSVEKPVPKPIPTKPSIKTTKPKISTPTIAPQPVEKSKKKADADVEGEVPKKETVKAGASKGPRIKTVARKDAESSKGKEIMEQEPKSDRFPADTRKVPATTVAEGSKPKKSGVLKMKSAAKGAAISEGTSTKSVQATYALVKQLSDQNQMMQNMLNSVTQLCTALQESYKRVEVRLDKAGIQGERILRKRMSHPMLLAKKTRKMDEILGVQALDFVSSDEDEVMNLGQHLSPKSSLMHLQQQSEVDSGNRNSPLNLRLLDQNQVLIENNVVDNADKI